MDDEVFLILLVALVILAIPACAIIALRIALSSRRAIAALQLRVAALEAGVAGNPAAAPEAARTDAPAPPPLSQDQADIEDAVAQAMGSVPSIPLGDAEPPAIEPPAIEPPAIEPTGPTPPAPEPVSAPGRSFEANLGSRWAVWVGGVALALGGLFLVRYSIEENLLSPGLRVLFGAAFAAGLAGAGEWLRRRGRAHGLPGIPSAHVPSVLTAAGTSTAFATTYAAYALYGLVGPTTAFILLGVISATAMLAATLHGPALAALGLVAALGSPFLVASSEPQPWPLVPYLAFVILAAYGVARLRLWRWLARTAAVGALLWTLPIALIGATGQTPAMTHVVIQLWLAGFFLVVEPYRRDAGAPRTDWLASGILLAFALACVALGCTAGIDSDERFEFAWAVALTLLGLGIGFAPAAPATFGAAVAVVGTLLLWPIRREIGSDPESLFFQGGDVFALRPEALGHYLTFALLGPAVIAFAALREVARSARPAPVVAWYAGAATLAPLLALVAAYWRVAELERDISFGLVAGGLALAFTAAAAWMRRHAGDLEGRRLGTGATAAASLAALSLGLTFVLDKGMLTVAFALTALGTAWVADRTAVPALRQAVLAIGLVIVGRLIWSPAIVPGDPGPPLLNWLLWGYGVPALCFGTAARLLARTGRDRTTQVAEGLCILFSAFLVLFEIRHAIHGGDPLAETSNHLEAGLVVASGLAFSLVLARLDVRRADPVYRIGAAVFKIVSLGLSAIALFGTCNPLFSYEPVLGGIVANSLVPAYLVPALLAFVLARLEMGTKPRIQVLASGVLGLLLLTAYLVLEIRRIFQGPDLVWWNETGQAEQWSYSVALLLLGIALLGLGLAR
ncbi:MAG: DUF2339 domain-containing protein, partial [Microvirga sp.]